MQGLGLALVLLLFFLFLFDVLGHAEEELEPPEAERSNSSSSGTACSGSCSQTCAICSSLSVFFAAFLTSVLTSLHSASSLSWRSRSDSCTSTTRERRRSAGKPHARAPLRPPSVWQRLRPCPRAWSLLVPWHVVRLDLHQLSCLLHHRPWALCAGGEPSPQRQRQTAARDATTSAVAAHAAGRLPQRDQPWPTARVSQHSGKVVGVRRGEMGERRGKMVVMVGG